MTPTPADPVSPVRVCRFVLAGEAFAIDVRWARGVAVLEELTRVPGAPPHLLGVAHIRGQILPVVEIRPLLGLAPGTTGEGTRLLVVEAAPLQAAIATDRVLGLASFEEVQPLADPPSRHAAAFRRGLLSRGDEPTTLLDAPGILAALRASVHPSDAGDGIEGMAIPAPGGE